MSAQALELLRSVRMKGAEVWLDDGGLRYRAPKGALTGEDMELLRGSRTELVRVLEQTDRLSGNVAPLTFSQLQHWHMYQLDETPAFRHIAAATRLKGRLHVQALRQSLADTFRRHEATRTRIVKHHGVPMQHIDAEAGDRLTIVDLQNCRDVDAAVLQQIDEVILDPIDVAVGPLVGVRLLRFGEREHVLIVAMDHIISDHFSLGLFLRDLFAGYVQRATGSSLALPPMTLQFPAYSRAQQIDFPNWLRQHGSYWQQQLAGCERLRFPRAAEPIKGRGWTSVPVLIDERLKAALRNWARVNRTTLVMSVFTAYAALVLRHCRSSDSVIQFVSSGRFTPDTLQTIGYFAFPLYLRVTLSERDTFADLFRRLSAEYQNACEHADFSYMEAQVPRPGFARNTDFNWIPLGTGPMPVPVPEGLASSGYEIECTDIPFEHPNLRELERDTEPFILFYDRPADIAGQMYFPRDQFSDAGMSRLVDALLVFLRKMVTDPACRIADLH